MPLAVVLAVFVNIKKKHTEHTPIIYIYIHNIYLPSSLRDHQSIVFMTMWWWCGYLFHPFLLQNKHSPPNKLCVCIEKKPPPIVLDLCILLMTCAGNNLIIITRPHKKKILYIVLHTHTLFIPQYFSLF